ncbi:MAG: mechanosensitive ion channel domain-containing protein [Cyanobacteria bacterium J06597_1]
MDGRILLHVHPTETLSAEERAQRINRNLLGVLENHDRMLVQLENTSDGEQTNISANGTHLLTVTQNDTLPQLTPEFQANVWEQQLQVALTRALEERTPSYRKRALTNSAIWVGGAIAAHALLELMYRIGTRRAYRARRKMTWYRARLPIIYLGFLALKVGIWSGAAYQITQLWPVLRHWRYLLYHFALASFQEPFLFTSSEEGGYSLLDIVVLLGLTVGLWLGAVTFARLLKSRILRPFGATSSMQEGIALLTQYALLILGTIAILQIWGLDPTSLTIVASVFSVGVGFGLQDILKNFISGWVVLLDKPVQVGDFINLGSLTGTVERIGARSTELRTLDRLSIIVPNSHFLDREVINWSHRNSVIRLHIPVGVAYGSDIRQVRVALLKAARSHPGVLRYPRPQVWFQTFDDSALSFELLVWLSDPRRQFSLKSDLNYRIEANLRKHGVAIPFPQRDVNLKSPRLEKFADVWLKDRLSPEELEDLSISDDVNLLPDPLLDIRSEEFFSSIQLENAFTNEQVMELAAKMREPGQLDIRDRRYRLKLYRHCFIGREAVDWLVESQRTTRENAVQIGQILMDRQVIQHVLDEQPFLDRHMFYRFVDDIDADESNADGKP